MRNFILIVDDSEDILFLHKLVLESAGFEVKPARSGPEALNALSDVTSVPSLILVDMLMPSMSGAEFLDRLEERRPDLIGKVPIAWFTGMPAVERDPRINAVIHKRAEDLNEFVDDVRLVLRG